MACIFCIEKKLGTFWWGGGEGKACNFIVFVKIRKSKKGKDGALHCILRYSGSLLQDLILICLCMFSVCHIFGITILK